MATQLATQQIPCEGSRFAGRGISLRLFAGDHRSQRGTLGHRGRIGAGVSRLKPCQSRFWGMNPASSRHIPVLSREAIELVAPRDGGVYVDATFGAGGYSRAILAIPGTRVIGIDRDRTAIAAGLDLVDRADGRLTLVEERFSQLAEVCAAEGFATVDGVLMDVGVSSMQLDEAG